MIDVKTLSLKVFANFYIEITNYKTFLRLDWVMFHYFLLRFFKWSNTTMWVLYEYTSSHFALRRFDSIARFSVHLWLYGFFLQCRWEIFRYVDSYPSFVYSSMNWLTDWKNSSNFVSDTERVSRIYQGCTISTLITSNTYRTYFAFKFISISNVFCLRHL